MEFTFLGTSSGVPTKLRNVSGLALKKQGNRAWVLIDCGEATQHQLLHTSHSLIDLEAVFITHVHGDHCYGLPGIIASAAMAGRVRPLPIVAPSGVREFLEVAIAHTDMHLSYELEFIDVEKVNLATLDISLSVVSIELSHRVRSFAYRFCEKDVVSKLDAKKLHSENVPPGKAWGELQNNKSVTLDDGRVLLQKNYLLKPRKPRAIIVGGDNDTPSLLENACKGADVLIHEATYTQEVVDKIGTHPMHSSAQKIAQFAQSVNIKNLVLTHFSARYQRNDTLGKPISDIEDEAKSFYKGNLFLANDFDEYALSSKGELVLINTVAEHN